MTAIGIARSAFARQCSHVNYALEPYCLATEIPIPVAVVTQGLLVLGIEGWFNILEVFIYSVTNLLSHFNAYSFLVNRLKSGFM